MTTRNRVLLVELPDVFPDSAVGELLLQLFPIVASYGYAHGMKGSGVWPAAKSRVVESADKGEAGYLAEAVSEFLRGVDLAEVRSALLRAPAKGSA